MGRSSSSSSRIALRSATSSGITSSYRVWFQNWNPSSFSLFSRQRGRVWLSDAMASTPLRFLILLVASWLRRHQAEALEYLQAENRVLRARLGPKRLRFSDPERRLLASAANVSDEGGWPRWRRWPRRKPFCAGTARGWRPSTTEPWRVAGPRFIIRDRDDKYGQEFDRAAGAVAARVLKTPVRAPRANAVCERFLGSVRRECLDQIRVLRSRGVWPLLQ